MKHIFTLKRLLSLLVLLLFSIAAWPWTPGLPEAAQALAAGRATPAQELMVFINNPELNLMAQEGRLGERVYAVCQDEFFQLNNRLVHQAADRAGYGASISDAKLNPGTDTDVNVLSKSGKPLRIEDIQKIEGQYQAVVREHFLGKDPQLDIPKSRIKTNTDFMPHPDHTAPGEFQKIADHINANGGTAYTNPRAASAQAKLGSRQPLTLDEASSFGTTMKDMASAKIRNADALHKEAQGLRGTNPAKAEMLEAQAAQYEYQAAKYHDRLTQLDQHLRNQFKLSDRPGASAVDNAAKRIGAIGRNPYSRSELGTIRSLHENALQRSTDDLIDTLLSSARKDPSRLADVRRIVTEQARSLPMSRAGQAMERLESTVKKVEAAQKWLAFKNTARDLSGIKQLTKVSVVMTAGGALLMGHEGVKVALTEVKATDTVWDFVKNVYIHAGWEGTGIGPAFDRAQAEELARYMKEFENGANPSMVKHVTFTILKSGVYLGKDVLIGVLYLPDTIWEYFTQEKELEAYAAYQNELAQAMHQMVLDRQAFEQIMTRFRKLGLHDEDALAFLNCLCRECGGSLGGLYNPGFKGEYGHGPCQCNGPLTIWKTPLPVQNTKVQYACFNAVTKMRYDQAQDMFNKWHQQAQKANAESVAPDLKVIEDEIRAGKVEREEAVAHDIADKIDAIKALLMPQDLDNLRAYAGPHLASHAARKIETGQIDRAIDDVDRVLNKIGTRHPQEEANLKSTQAQYQQWAKAWAQTKEKQFPAIDQRLQKGQVHTARGELDALEYRMMKEQPRKLPYAAKDPQFVALKERVLAKQKAYSDALQATWAESSAHQKARDPRGALPILQKTLSSWEHLPDTTQGLQRQIAYDQGEVDKAQRHAAQGQQDEKQGALAAAIERYKASLAIQQDDALQRHLAQLQGTLAEQQRRMAQAKQLRDQGAALQQQNQIPQAIAKYRESLALVPDPALEAHIRNLQTQWDAQQAQQQRLAQAKRLRDEGAALQQRNQIAEAIEKFRQSLALVPDPALEAHVRALQATLTPKPNPTPAPVSTPAPVQKPVISRGSTGTWEYVGIGDCPGNDIAGGAQGDAPDPKVCDDQHAGLAAVCWDSRTPRAMSPPACTIKSVKAENCKGGANPGRMYRCKTTGQGPGHPSNQSPTGQPKSGFYLVDLTPYGGKKDGPTTVNGILIDRSSWLRLKHHGEDGHAPPKMQLAVSVPSVSAVTAIALNGNLDHAHLVPQGTTVTKMTVLSNDGNLAFDIKAGVHMSEWNGPNKHQVAPTGSGSNYLPVFNLPRPMTVTGLRFDYVEMPTSYDHGSDAPGFCLRGITLVGAGSPQSGEHAPTPAQRTDIAGTWRHHPQAAWTITPSANGGWFAQEAGLGNASGPGHWTATGTFRIDYVTRDGTIKGYYDMRFNADGFSAEGKVQELNGPKRSGNSHWERITIHSPDLVPAPTAAHSAAQPAPTPAAPTTTAQGRVLFDNGNTGGVYNQPTQATRIHFASPVTITKLTNYHWNNGRGTPRAGTVGLRDASGRLFGPWPAQGSPGQGNVPNAYWNTHPNATLPAGDYTVEDSDPASWAQNSGSRGAGHTRIEGVGNPGLGLGVGVGVGAGQGSTAPTSTSSPAAPPKAAHSQRDGRYGGAYSGQGQGTLNLTLQGTSAQGTLTGQVDGDPVSATLAGSVDDRGQLHMVMKGVVRWTMQGSTSRGETPFAGELTGTVQGARVSGKWTARSTDGKDYRSGTWSASR